MFIIILSINRIKNSHYRNKEVHLAFTPVGELSFESLCLLDVVPTFVSRFLVASQDVPVVPESEDLLIAIVVLQLLEDRLVDSLH